MKTLWLNKKNNSKLILFFNGWGMDENPIKHLVYKVTEATTNVIEKTFCPTKHPKALYDSPQGFHPQEELQSLSAEIASLTTFARNDENILYADPLPYDILMVYDYSDLNFDENIENYSEITLIAWSMGVFAASMVCSELKIQKSIAINGTQNPIDVKFGINPKIYQLTLDNFCEKTRDNFLKNMFLDGNEYEKLQKPLRNLENQKKELEFLQKTAKENPSANFNFDYAIISANDKIISSKNQENFWQTKKVKVVKLSNGHYPFFELKNFKEIISETL